jgi:hypothetical protein
MPGSALTRIVSAAPAAYFLGDHSNGLAATFSLLAGCEVRTSDDWQSASEVVDGLVLAAGGEIYSAIINTASDV